MDDFDYLHDAVQASRRLHAFANLREITPATFEPVSLDEARQQLHLDAGNDDTDGLTLPQYIRAARAYAESYTGLLLTDAVYELRVDALHGPLFFPVAPVSVIAAATYIDFDGAERVLDQQLFELDDHPTRPALRVVFDQRWPVVRRQANAVRIRFHGPYSETSDPPVRIAPEIKQALLLLIGHWYLNREDVVIGATAVALPQSAATLLNLHRRNLGA